MEDLSSFGLKDNPRLSFLDWYEIALLKEENAQAMSVATYDEVKKRPSNRILLFKGFQNQSMIFYTNYLSSKSLDLEKNPEVALAFYWHVSGKQVRIQGRVNKMGQRESAHYFHSRDRDSQIASYVSLQSSPILDKKSLLTQFTEAKKHFEGQEIPHPNHWGGFLVDPYEYEFFLYGENRLNDRLLYTQNNEKWEVTRLAP